MLTIFISSLNCIEKPILNGFPCNITKIYSGIENGNEEPGYRIDFRDITNENFRDNIWPKLKEQFGLKCAFVRKKYEYMGCILNWPNVFTKSNCVNICKEF